MKSELILTSSEVEDLAVCVDCGLQECMDCPRNKAKQKLKEAARNKGAISYAVAQTVEVIHIVRCHECKHRGTDDCIFHIKGEPADEELLRKLDNDFCSYGERKEGAD